MPLDEKDIDALLGNDKFTASLAEKLGESLGDRINSTVSDHAKRTAKKSKEELQASIAEAVTAAMSKLPAPAPVPVDDKGKGATGAISPEMKLLQEKQQKLEDALKASEEKSKRIELQSRVDQARQSLRGALKAAGVKDELLDDAVDLAVARGSLKLGEDGNPLLVVKRQRTKTGPTEELEFEDLAQGAKDWAQTPGAAHYLPAPTPTGQQRKPGTQGVGARAASRAPVAGESEQQKLQRISDDLERRGIDPRALTE